MAVHSSRGCAYGPLTPETLLPSYQTTTRTPRTLPVRPAPPLTLAAHISYAQAVVVEDGGGWRRSTAQGPLQPSWGRAPSRGPWWRCGRTPFHGVLGRSMTLASRTSALGPGEGALGDGTRIRPSRYMSLYMYFRVGMLVSPHGLGVGTLRDREQGSGGGDGPTGQVG